jgi:hypothetical protein
MADTSLGRLKLSTEHSPQWMWIITIQCPRAIIMPAVHCRPTNLNRIYNGNICQWYCGISHWQWSSNCFTETANQPGRDAIIFKEIRKRSWWIQVGPCHIHHRKRNLTPPPSTSSETSVLTRATWRNIQKDTIRHSHHWENLKSFLGNCLSVMNMI